MSKVVITGIDTSTLPKLSGKEQAELMQKLKAGDEKARDDFAICNMRLVLSVLQRFRGRCNSTDDLFQVGCVGLMKAIDNFDVTQNVKFSTYAVPMIIGEIKRFLRDNNSVRVSRSLRDTAYKVLKAREDLIRTNGEEPSVDMVSDYLGVSVSDVAIALEAISEPMSLCDPVYNDGDDTIYLMDQVSNSKDSEDKWVEDINLRDALSKLGEREKEIVMLRYYVGKTQMEVSEEIGISQAQVSRLEKNAIKEIRKAF
ncbi:MAG: RNA polymerase sporulation sigma factor SigG [Clostridiales bacterium]|nr:RNA polymerase sporulation sigma factor SigG [Clostridiales bacterium]